MLNHGRVRWFMIVTASALGVTAVNEAVHGQGDTSLLMGVLSVFNIYMGLNLPRGK